MIFSVIAGANGSGKSSFARALPIKTIDPDRIAAEYGEGFTAAANLRASREALRLTQLHLADQRELAVETTLASRQPLRLMAQAKGLGYEIRLIFIVADAVEDTRLRIDNRVLLGGHNIPDVDLERRDPRILEHLPGAVLSADMAVLYVSSVSKQDFSLEGAKLSALLQITSAVPVRVRDVLVQHIQTQHLPAISDTHPVTHFFPVNVKQRL